MQSNWFEGLAAHEIYALYLQGQRQVLGVTDRQISDKVLRYVEETIEAAIEEEYEVHDCVMDRYILGELTDGLAPRAFASNQQTLRRQLKWFFIVVELLRVRADLRMPNRSKSGRRLSKKQRIEDGKFGPFVQFRIAGDSAIMCYECKKIHHESLVMAMKPPACVSCGATSIGAVKDDDSGNREKSTS